MSAGERGDRADLGNGGLLSPEIRDILSWLGPFPRSPLQTHGLNQSDAEILRLNEALYLASSTDSLSEEWQCGLYQDPWTLGWMVATASLSDLAAVGATPLGLLLSTEWPHGFALDSKQRFATGVRAALQGASTYLLGGDSGHSAGGAWGATALGLTQKAPMSRVGLQPGWVLGLSLSDAGESRLGCGPALGMRSVLRGPDSDFPEDLYRPEAQLRLGQALHEEGVSVCIDTSDGLWSSLALLSDLNPGCSFSLNWQEDLLHRRAKTYFEALRYPLLSLWVFEHGDYQLLFGAPTEVWARLEARNLPVRQLGRVLAGAEHSRLQVAQATFTVDLSCGRRVLNPGLREDGSEVPWQERAQELFSILRAANLP